MRWMEVGEPPAEAVRQASGCSLYQGAPRTVCGQSGDAGYKSDSSLTTLPAPSSASSSSSAASAVHFAPSTFIFPSVLALPDLSLPVPAVPEAAPLPPPPPLVLLDPLPAAAPREMGEGVAIIPAPAAAALLPGVRGIANLAVCSACRERGGAAARTRRGLVKSG